MTDNKKGKIIFLNGVTSCGKTSVMSFMRKMCETPLFCFSNDIFHSMVSYGAYDSYWKFVADTITAQYYAARGLCEAGYDVIIDGMLLDLPEYKELRGMRNIELVEEIFSGLEVIMVDITCSPVELRRRNIARGDRGEGQSDEQLGLMTRDFRRDITLDAMTVMPDEAARRILSYCGYRIRPIDDDQINNIAAFRRRFFDALFAGSDVKSDASYEDDMLRVKLWLSEPTSARNELLLRGYTAVSDDLLVRPNLDGQPHESIELYRL